MISMSDENEIFIAGGDDNKVHVYLNKGDKFVNDDALIDSLHDTTVAEITGDAQWILTVDESGILLIYKFSFKTHKYELYQSIPVNDGSSYTYAGTITDDHMWIVFGNDNGYVYVYSFDGTEFMLNQTIFHQSTLVSSVALTNDHLLLAIANYPTVYIHEYNGTQFNIKQTISLGSSKFRRVRWTEDHQYLSFAGEN